MCNLQKSMNLVTPIRKCGYPTLKKKSHAAQGTMKFDWSLNFRPLQIKCIRLNFANSTSY